MQTYIAELQTILASGDAREHAYRPSFQKLIESIRPDIQVINEPAYTGGNAPDFLFKKGDTPIAYAECKDVTVDLQKKDVQKQAQRYAGAFGKILLTNYFDFEIIDEGGLVTSISIATRDNNTLQGNPDVYETFVNIIKNYITQTHRTITSAKRLAEIMANKARLLRDNALASLSENTHSDIYAQYETFKNVLVKDLSPEDFADMYAQTIVYGLFVARYHDPTLPTFSRYEAQDLLPSTNPLLKKFFGHVAGTDYDSKIAWLVDSLIESYLATDVAGIMHKEFEKKHKDPVLHFYETFLSQYDAQLRKNRGVYYTPEPVVSFMVKSVDQILKTKFNLSKGLADTSTIPFQFKLSEADGRTKDGMKSITKDIHKVQILDPAVGTGTFLNEIIHHIHASFKGQEGLWNGYVNQHLLQRLHGFELMMASYTMAHLKLGITLQQLGYSGNDRLSVWLTNSLEEGIHEVPSLFMSQWLTEESNQASKIKSEMPVMVVIGNPPYSGVSSNNSEHATAFADKYKIEPGGKQKLQERKHWLNDDYVKFISFAEDQIDKTGEGIVSFITPHGFLDNPTFRGMRWHLLQTFDEIYVLDLHGNAKKKETTPEGNKDENVFNIQQGVAILFGIKKKESANSLATVYRRDLYGKRFDKFEKLSTLNFDSTPWQKIDYRDPDYFFAAKDYEVLEVFTKGFSVSDLFSVRSVGFVSANDISNISMSKDEHKDKVTDLLEMSEDDWRLKYNRPKDAQSWKYSWAKKDVFENKDRPIVKVGYRPFDVRYTLYTGVSGGVYARPSYSAMQHFLLGDNVGLVARRQQPASKDLYIFSTNNIISDGYIRSDNKGGESVFPLYLYTQNLNGEYEKTPNFDADILNKIEEGLELKMNEGFTPEDILDYIYAVLHSPNYREKYQEFLKIDFPRVPYPSDITVFKKLVVLGKEIRQYHLMEHVKSESYITTYPNGGDNIVAKKYPQYVDGKVYINKEQYFDGVPQNAWEFYIGGYQPAQKWLKDRRERELLVDDILHYQKIIVALVNTDRLMKEID